MLNAPWRPGAGPSGPGSSGGIVRDVLVAQVPAVLKADLYAVAALAGAGVVVTAHALGLPAAPSMLAGAALCFGLRVMAIRHGWQLPVPRQPDREDRS